ncbi:helix-turn-helix domain-containing protein [Corynebacterium argentoratense]|jgi:putative transcriptional regulator|uniref:helix-turn-helix domain-containing protein n=1 Tax=Corynebacterium argentoratense TaxID=42817 RepID=UPI00248E9167|nr:helix-turn-helix transcriptional regulator [Corynebacterium argentoratense]
MKTNLVFSYKPLWKLLIDRDLNKTQLQELSGISAATMAKLGKGGNVTTEVLARICETLECDIADICEVVPGIVQRPK